MAIDRRRNGWAGGALALAAAAAPAALGQQLQFEHEGPAQNYEQFGFAVTELKDVDGDGCDEYAVGGPLEGQHVGVVVIFSGKTGTPLFTLSGSTGSMFGFALADAGDMDGDGLHDLAIGAPGNPLHGNEDGYVLVVRGSDASAIVKIDGTGGERLGHSVAGFDDVDGDGLADLAVGAPGWNDDTGSVRVYDHSGNVIWHVDGTQAGAQFGFDVSDAGIIKSPDGTRDVIVGEPYFDTRSAADVGRAHALSGIDGTVIWTWTGDAAGDWFGTSVDGIGYMSATSSHDVIVGAPGSDVNGTDAGMARLFDGFSGSTLYTLRGDDDLDLFGWCVRGVKIDLGDDGYPDFMIGAPSHHSDGEPGLVRVYTAFGILVHQYDDPSDNCQRHKFFGTSIGCPDTNGDTQPDLIVGMPGDFFDCDMRGSAWVYWVFTDKCIDYGAGWPGTLGEPRCDCTDPPDVGGRAQLFVGNSLGARTPGLLFVGLEATDVPTGADGHLLVKSLILAFPLLIDADGTTLTSDIPDDPTLGGFSLFVQAIMLDRGASKGIAFTNGVELRLGWPY